MGRFCTGVSTGTECLRAAASSDPRFGTALADQPPGAPTAPSSFVCQRVVGLSWPGVVCRRTRQHTSRNDCAVEVARAPLIYRRPQPDSAASDAGWTGHPRAVRGQGSRRYRPSPVRVTGRSGTSLGEPYRAMVTVIGALGHRLSSPVSAASSVASTLRPHRVLSATQSVTY